MSLKVEGVCKCKGVRASRCRGSWFVFLVDGRPNHRWWLSGAVLGVAAELSF
jgi:hypothetical protein